MISLTTGATTGSCLLRRRRYHPNINKLNPSLPLRRTPTLITTGLFAISSSSSSSSSDTNKKAPKPKKQETGSGGGFVDEMRMVAMRLHTREQAPKEGKKESTTKSDFTKWDPSIPSYLRFLVDSHLVYQTLESIVQSNPLYDPELTNTGLERAGRLEKDLDWFRETFPDYQIPPPSSPGIDYSNLLRRLAQEDPPAFISHFYNVYFAHSAGGRMIGKKVAAKILDNRELEFYKWDGDLSELLQNVRDKINKIAESWTREEKDHCLEQTEESFKYSGELLRLIFT